MFQTEYVSPSPESEAAQPSLPESDQQQPERERLCILLYGSRRAVERTIQQLHNILRYVEQFRWTDVAVIPENGITITRTDGETYSLLTRELSMN